MLMTCPNCKWVGQVIACDCDDDGRLHCPRCGSVVKRIDHE